jgi:hypothetical protein
MPVVTGGLVVAIIVATAFNFTNGVQDAADAVATHRDWVAEQVLATSLEVTVADGDPSATVAVAG